ncbi:drug/metabolite transporter (DMT)-like permease [Alkalibacillus filiformis]|uniref:Drug/metabolite transporter (DMT)-like permease n=1 Tax=Alkalibacillus filiformis TaxID=200990 RepID=A0ABU0DPM4_9BACI|nr:DMT family transporter [Alkalibacillus filiformis]MDQ0350315.1 drug/metabolite transporter (DMT)-like permease [Alkalibacillus filiformis]
MRMRMNNFIAYGMVIFGAGFWGLTGLFVQNLYDYGFTPWQVVTLRLTFSSLILLTMLAIFARSYLKIRLIDLPYFIALGVVSIALFNWFYFQVMDLASLSVAVVFVYTSPVFAAIIAKIFFNEALTVTKIIAILMTITGSAFAIEFFPIGEFSLTIQTIIYGLLAGFFCSTYSLIGKDVSRWYHPFTITTYAMLCGTLFLIPTSGIWQNYEAFAHGDVWLNILGIVIISTIVAYLLYTNGLAYVESSKATILASIEIVIAVIVGVVVFNEILTGWQLFGFVLLFGSLFLTVFSFKGKVKVKKPRDENHPR